MRLYSAAASLTLIAVLAIGSMGFLASCSTDHSNTPTTNRATATIISSTSQTVGTATFTEGSDGVVTMVVSVTGLPAGQHGIHFHMVGKAEPSTAFMSAGDHFNPDMKKHGLSNPDGAHNGDLPNLVVDAQGVGRLEASSPRVTLSPGAKTVFDADGTAIVIHTNADDQITDPSGNSGGRIAAGVVTRQ